MSNCVIIGHIESRTPPHICIGFDWTSNMEGVIGYQLIFQMILVMMLLIPLLYWLKLKRLDLHVENLVKIGDNEFD